MLPTPNPIHARTATQEGQLNSALIWKAGEGCGWPTGAKHPGAAATRNLLVGRYLSQEVRQDGQCQCHRLLHGNARPSGRSKTPSRSR